jgi:hypothetical protein
MKKSQRNPFASRYRAFVRSHCLHYWKRLRADQNRRLCVASYHMKQYSTHAREAMVLTVKEANCPLCAQEIEEWMHEHLPEAYREAKTKCKDIAELFCPFNYPP